jgi:predicted nucleic acid-binding protein
MNIFVDSTTLLYTLDRALPEKRAICVAWLRRLRLSGRMRLSLQVLAECYAVVRRKPAFAAARPLIRAYLSDLSPWLCPPATLRTTQRAWRLEDDCGLGWWDSLLLATAAEADCTMFLSEDLNDGQSYGMVQVINPFRHDPETVRA